MFWCRIRGWQIYNWCTLCCYAALQATVLLPASSWFSLSTHSRCGEYLYSHGKWKIHYSRSICSFYTRVKFNFLSFHIGLSPDIQASGMAVGLPAGFCPTYCTSTAVTTTTPTTTDYSSKVKLRDFSFEMFSIHYKVLLPLLCYRLYSLSVYTNLLLIVSTVLSPWRV